MESSAIGGCGVLALMVCMFLLKIPPGFSMAVVGFIGIIFLTLFKAALGILGTEFWGIFSGYGLTVIPMFILVGEFIYHAGYSDRLYHTTYKWFGHWRGGLAVTTIVASAGFSAICGSNSATAATMSAVSLPAMKKYNYHPTLKTGSIAAGSTLGVMVPPSIVLVVYGLYTGQSIGKLFYGTLIPSATLIVLFAITVHLVCVRHPDWGPQGERQSWSEKFKALPQVVDIVILFLVIMLALLTGFVTATEAASLACFLSLLLCVLRRRLTWAKFQNAVFDTLRISCMVFMIVGGATIFGRFMTLTRLPFDVSSWIGSLNWPGWAIILVMSLFYMIGGCLMDALAFLLISLPIFLPLVKNMGYDPIWFGELLCVVTTLGAITPPVGICCYVVSGMAPEIPMEKVFRGAMYFLPAYFITIGLLILFPKWMVMFLANFAR